MRLGVEQLLGRSCISTLSMMRLAWIVMVALTLRLHSQSFRRLVWTFRRLGLVKTYFKCASSFSMIG